MSRQIRLHLGLILAAAVGPPNLALAMFNNASRSGHLDPLFDDFTRGDLVAGKPSVLLALQLGPEGGGSIGHSVFGIDEVDTFDAHLFHLNIGNPGSAGQEEIGGSLIVEQTRRGDDRFSGAKPEEGDGSNEPYRPRYKPVEGDVHQLWCETDNGFIGDGGSAGIRV